MNRLLMIVALSIVSGAAVAQHAGHGSAPTKAAAQAADEWAQAEVRRIDADTARLSLRHGPIKSLDMPPMTMMFNVASPQLLEGLKVGDRVRFKVISASGKYTITALEVER